MAGIKMRRLLTILIAFLTSCCFCQNLEYKFSEDIENDTDTTYGYQRHSWDLSRIGRYGKALTFWDKDHNSNYQLSELDSLKFLQYKPVNAINYIISKADSFQVIMMNEAHHSSLHRHFMAQLLRELYEKGFRYFGLEALNIMDTVINVRKYPTQYSGFYIDEPVFGNLIRLALETGYVVFGYDVQGKNGKEREIGQAENIKTIIDNDPHAKILIHAGFGHIREDENFGSWEKAMAGRFKEFTGINPLTIDQVEMSERSKPEKENPVYRIELVSESSIFINENKEPFVDNHSGKIFDLQVFHPRTNFSHNRPDWLFTSDKQYFSVMLPNDIEFTLPCLVFAYKKSEYETEKLNNLIPADIIELDKDNFSDIGFVLTKGNYVFVYKAKTGQIIEKEIRID